MSYTQELVIAMSKTAYTRHALLEKDLPEMLTSYTPTAMGHAMYWRITDIEWHVTYSRVSELIDFFAQLSKEDNSVNASGIAMKHLTPEASYGAMRLGAALQEGVRTWGRPEDFDIRCSRCIASPISP